MSLYRGKHLVADFDAVSVTVDGQPIRLTRREFELLKCLVENRNRVLSRDRLLERVWGYEQFIETRSVDVHVGRLRSKLGGRRAADRNRRRPRLPVRGVSAGDRTACRSNACIARSTRCQSVYSVVTNHLSVALLPHIPPVRLTDDGDAIGVMLLSGLFGGHERSFTSGRSGTGSPRS